MNVLIINGTVVTESGVYPADVLVEGGRIKAIGKSLAGGIVETESSGQPGYGKMSESSGQPGYGKMSESSVESERDAKSELGFSESRYCESGSNDNKSSDSGYGVSGLVDGGIQIIDASGKYILPGAVDVHTHMDLDVGFARACDDFYTGTVAAACGGTTTIVDHMAFGPKGCSLWHQVEEYHRLADGKAVVDYGFHGVLQHVHKETLGEMKEIAEKEGITSFKAYMTYADRLEDADLFRVLRAAKESGIVIAAHCENDGVISVLRKEFAESGRTAARYHPLSRPAGAEAEAVSRFIHIAAMAGNAPVYIVHLSSEAGLQEVKKARASGQPNLGVETCPQYLILNDTLYEDPQDGLKAVMSPPLRKDTDRMALWQALSDDVLDVVGTDHCPFLFSTQKQRGAYDFTLCPNGAPGVQERLNLMYSEGVAKGRITLPQLVHYCCTNPARLFGLYPKKGALKTGADADIVIFDPQKEHVFYAKDIRGAADYSCYEGMKMQGTVETVMLRGEVVVKDGEWIGKRGFGQYLKRGKVAFRAYQ